MHKRWATRRDEAEPRLCESVGGVCVFFARAVDGTVKTSAYEGTGLRRRGWRFWAGPSQGPTGGSQWICGARPHS
jgi:hypothetical protein